MIRPPFPIMRCPVQPAIGSLARSALVAAALATALTGAGCRSASRETTRDAARETARSLPRAPQSPSLDGVTDPDRIWAILGEGNAAYVTQAADGAARARRAALAQKQAPRAAVLACADSRCSPELVMRREPGDLFVVRTAGNIADSVAIGSIEYAVAVLGAPVVIVLGHESCGAVKAAVVGEPTGSAHIDGIVWMIRPAVLRVPGEGATPERLSAAVKENVRRTGRRLMDASPIIASAVQAGTLRVILAVHDLETGRVTAIE
jgi:carbonic anhydrase